MHEWGDEWDQKNGHDLDSAIRFCMDTFRRARIGCHGKEKYGTFRDHCYFWDGGLHTLIWPGYVRIMNRFLYFQMDRYLIRPFTRYTGILWLGRQVQYAVYNYAIQTACKRYPNVIDELVSHINGYKLVKPGIFGRVDGTAINNKYWKTLD